MGNRCSWAPATDELMCAYHDKEWGRPVHDDQKLFEFIVLETFQAGLSWKTILHKRENFRKAFKNFDPKKVAKMKEDDILKLMQNEGIIRNKAKIEAAINNAQVFLHLQKEHGSFDKYFWQFTDYKTIQNKVADLKKVPVTTKESDAMSKAMKKEGFKFVGSTTCYATMQAVGMVNDHLVSCNVYNECAKF